MRRFHRPPGDSAVTTYVFAPRHHGLHHHPHLFGEWIRRLRALLRRLDVTVV